MAICRCAKCGSLHEGTPADFNYCANCGGTGAPISQGGGSDNATQRRIGPVKMVTVESKETSEDAALFFDKESAAWYVKLPTVGFFVNCSNHKVSESNGLVTFSPSLKYNWFDYKVDAMVELHGYINNSVWTDC